MCLINGLNRFDWNSKTLFYQDYCRGSFVYSIKIICELHECVFRTVKLIAMELTHLFTFRFISIVKSRNCYCSNTIPDYIFIFFPLGVNLYENKQHTNIYTSISQHMIDLMVDLRKPTAKPSNILMIAFCSLKPTTTKLENNNERFMC